MVTYRFIPIRFISESVEVAFNRTPTLQKKQGCPDRFTWRETTYTITEKLSEWHDYSRRGRTRSNMRPEHAEAAERHGSWGVGRDYYRVRTESGHVFELYYDRAPGSADDRKGSWILYRELKATRRDS